MTSPDPDPGPGPAETTLAVLSTLGGRLKEPFVAQFRGMHRGPVQLLLDLHPALHHDHLADTVAEILNVLGVAEVRLINRAQAAPVLLDDAGRAALAGYAVRVIRGNDDQPMVCLYHPEAKAALITSRLAEPGGATWVDQRTLHLADLVDQAARHAAEYAAEKAGTDMLDLSTFLPDPEPALRCDTCGRVTGAGVDAEAIEVTAGAECNYDDPRTGEECPGHLEAVTIVVAPARPAWPKDRAPATVYAVVFGNYDPAEIDSLWATEAAAQRHADAKESGAWRVQEWAVLS